MQHLTISCLQPQRDSKYLDADDGEFAAAAGPMSPLTPSFRHSGVDRHSKVVLSPLLTPNSSFFNSFPGLEEFSAFPWYGSSEQGHSSRDCLAAFVLRGKVMTFSK